MASGRGVPRPGGGVEDWAAPRIANSPEGERPVQGVDLGGTFDDPSGHDGQLAVGVGQNRIAGPGLLFFLGHGTKADFVENGSRRFWFPVRRSRVLAAPSRKGLCRNNFCKRHDLKVQCRIACAWRHKPTEVRPKPTKETRFDRELAA